MKGLMELLSKSTDSTKGSKPDSDSYSKEPEDDYGSEESSASGFSESASQAMDALKAGDGEAFSDALKACIEMVR